jgi:hypothetical protein
MTPPSPEANEVNSTAAEIFAGDGAGALTGVTAAAPTTAALMPAIRNERGDTRTEWLISMTSHAADAADNSLRGPYPSA